MRVSLLSAALLLTCAATWSPTTTAADCSYPRAPDGVPNGKTASETDMVAAMSVFKQYNSEVTAYLSCLDQDTADKLKEAGSATATIMQIKTLQSKKHNSAVEELKSTTEKFNEQVRNFKTRK